MQKFIQKFFVLILILGGYQRTEGKINDFYEYCQLCHAAGPIASVIETVMIKNRLQRASDVPEIVKRFCYKKLRAQGLKDDLVRIKIIDFGEVASFGNNYIIFSEEAAFELKNALRNPNQNESINTIELYSFFLDHEIAHLKNNDGPIKCISAYTGASLLCLALSMVIMQAPSYRRLFENNQVNESISSSRSTFPRSLVGFCSHFFALFLYFRYKQFQEKRADSYAIALSKNPGSLRLVANCLEESEDYLMDCLSEAKFDEFSPFNSIIMRGLRRVLLTFYTMKGTDETFHSWVKRQPISRILVRIFMDPEHPSGYSRAQAMRLAANAIEAARAKMLLKKFETLA
jgi:hypothetical protein